MKTIAELFGPTLILVEGHYPSAQNQENEPLEDRDVYKLFKRVRVLLSQGEIELFTSSASQRLINVYSYLQERLKTIEEAQKHKSERANQADTKLFTWLASQIKVGDFVTLCGRHSELLPTILRNHEYLPSASKSDRPFRVRRFEVKSIDVENRKFVLAIGSQYVGGSSYTPQKLSRFKGMITVEPHTRSYEGQEIDGVIKPDGSIQRLRWNYRDNCPDETAS